MNTKYFITFIACWLCLGSRAQNLTGRWQWTIQGSGQDIQSDYLIELDLKQEGSRVYGLRTLYLKNYDDIVVKVEGTVNSSGEVNIFSQDVVQCTLPDSILVAKAFSYKLHLRSGTDKRLDGDFFPKEDPAKVKYRTYDPVFYDAIYNRSFSSPFKKLADTLSNKAMTRMGIAPAKVLPPAVVTEVQSRLTIPAVDVSIDLYDNGEIDGDTITLMVNDKVISEHKRLSTHAIHFDLKKVEMSDTTTIIMRAENLGSIPPNTALMLITAAGKRYDVRLSSDLKKQAAVVLYQKK